MKEFIKESKKSNVPYVNYKGFIINLKGVSGNNFELTFKRFLALVALYNINLFRKSNKRFFWDEIRSNTYTKLKHIDNRQPALLE